MPVEVNGAAALSLLAATETARTPTPSKEDSGPQSDGRAPSRRRSMTTPSRPHPSKGPRARARPWSAVAGM